jgi:hypothetical protein
MGHVQSSRLISAPVSKIYDHITDLRNLGLWLRPDLDVEWPTNGDDPIPKVREHSETALYLVRFGIALRVSVRFDELKPNEGYTYRQRTGIFRSFVHTQTLRVHDSKTTLFTDLVDFQAPLGILGSLLDDLWLKNDVERILAARLERIDHFFKGPVREDSKLVMSQ